MIRSILSVASTRLAASVLQGATLFGLAHLLGAARFGLFVTLVAIGALSGVILGLGTSSLALRLKSLDDPRSTAGGIALLRYPTSLCAASVTLAAAFTILGAETRLLVLVAVAFSFADTTGEVVESVLFGLQKHVRAQYSMLTRRVAIATSVGVGWATEDVLIAVGIASVAVVLAAPCWLFREVERPKSLKSVVAAAYPFWGATLLSKVQSADVILASIVASPAQSGVYAAASRLTSPLNTLTTSTISILTPSLAAVSDQAVRLASFRRMRQYLLALTLALLVASPVIGWLTEFALGSEFEGVALPAGVLAASTGVAALTQGYVAFFFAIGNPRAVIRARLISTSIAGMVAVPLALQIGTSGVALAILLLQLLQVVTLTREFRSTVSIHHLEIEQSSQAR